MGLECIDGEWAEMGRILDLRYRLCVDGRNGAFQSFDKLGCPEVGAALLASPQLPVDLQVIAASWPHLWLFLWAS